MSNEEANAASPVEDIEIPDVIEQLPKPDKAKHDAKIAKLDDEIKKLQTRMAEIRDEMDMLKTNRGDYGSQIQEAKAKFAALRSEKDNIIQQRNQITARLRQTRDDKGAALKHQRNMRSTLKYGTVEEFDAAIANLKHKQETSSMSLSEEKRVIKEIEQLQSQKKQIPTISGDQGVVEKQNESIKEMQALQAKKNEGIDALQEKLNEQKKVLDKLYRLNEDENKKDKFPALAKERKEIKEQLDEKFTAIKALRKEFKEANDKYYNNIRLVRKKKELERQKEEEARRAEYEAQLADYEKEMAKLHPYQDEMDLCDALVSFLEKTYAKELNEEQNEKTAAETAATPVELDGMKPLQRKEEDFMMLGGSKKGKKNRQVKKSKKTTKLALPLAQMEAFSTIGVLPPAALSAVSDSLAAVKAKKSWFNEQTSRLNDENSVGKDVETAAAAKPMPQKKSDKNKKFNASDKDAFPSLGGGAADIPSWGPGVAPPESDVATDFAVADVVIEDA